MTPGDWFLAVMSAGYIGAAIAYGLQGNIGYAVALGCYACANGGLIYAAR